MMIAEDAALVRTATSASLTQDGEDFAVYGFLPEMTAADRSGREPRDQPIDVSESQREIIDLAFRIALITAAGQGYGSTLVMETPEASLDAIAMDRVGSALARFAKVKGNHLIATSNLTNSQMIAAMFGGPVRSASALDDRERRTLNLLAEAAPNRALQKHRQRYELILREALEGRKA